MKVIVEHRPSFGHKNRYYPVNDIAKAFAELCGRTCLPLRILEQIKKLGFEVEILNPPPRKQTL